MQVGVKNVPVKTFDSKLKQLKSVEVYIRGDKAKDNTNLNIIETARK